MSYNQPNIHSNAQNLNNNSNKKPIAELMSDLKAKMQLVFHDRANIDKMATGRGLPPFVLREIMSVNPLSVCIKQEYGGRGAHTHQILEINYQA